MQIPSDTELLSEYAAHKSEAAFGEIVHRYADFVYSAALRQVGDSEQARDVAQTVFVDLARKAGALPTSTLLIGWLCQGARLAALEQLRKDQRRLRRERQAMELHDPATDSPEDWNTVRPVLDEAIAHLGDEDRHALLLRFFKNESLASVGTTLGVSEDAAQKRVSRALGKLREFLVERGISTTGAALALALTANAVQAAPTGLAASLAAGALTKATVVGSATAPMLKLFSFTNMKTAVLIVALAGGIAGLTLKQVAVQRELHQAEILSQQQAAALENLRTAYAQLGTQTNELESLRRDTRDLLRLRAEVTQLRRQLAEVKTSAPGVKAESAANATTNDPAAFSEAQINVRARFVSTPTNLNFSADDMARSLGEGKAELLNSAEFTADDITVLAQPSVTTLSGRQAELQILQSVTNVTLPSGLIVASTNIGATLEVMPVASTNSSFVDLTFVVTVNDLLDVSPQKDGSQTVFHSLVLSNSMTIPNGQTVIVAGRIPAGGQWSQPHANSRGTHNSHRNLLVFLTPSIVDAAGNQIQSQPDNGSRARSITFDSDAALLRVPVNPE